MKHLLNRLRAIIGNRRFARSLSEREATITYMLTTLGNSTVLWSAINLILNTFFEWNQQRLGVNLPRGLPKSFTSKLKLLKSVEKDGLWSALQRAEMRAIRIDLGALNSLRTELVHGLVHMTGLDENFVIYIAKEEGHELIRKSVGRNYTELRQFCEDLSKMTERLTVLLNPILSFDSER